jgi:hypothetical protein
MRGTKAKKTKKRPRGCDLDDDQKKKKKKKNPKTAHALYESVGTGTEKDRQEGPLFHLKTFHNKQIKSTMIREFAGSDIVDLACGRGGDVFKVGTSPSRIGFYLGIDFSEAEVKDARARLNKGSFQSSSSTTFRFKVADLREPITDDDKIPRFASAMCNFALHYFCESQETLDAFFRNVDRLLSRDPGSTFFGVVPDGDEVTRFCGRDNGVVSVTRNPRDDGDEVSYLFTLRDSVVAGTSPEFAAFDLMLLRAADKVGLEAVYHYPPSLESLTDSADSSRLFKRFYPRGYDGALFEASHMFACFAFRRR